MRVRGRGGDAAGGSGSPGVFQAGVGSELASSREPSGCHQHVAAGQRHEDVPLRPGGSPSTRPPLGSVWGHLCRAEARGDGAAGPPTGHDTSYPTQSVSDTRGPCRGCVSSEYGDERVAFLPRPRLCLGAAFPRFCLLWSKPLCTDVSTPEHVRALAVCAHRSLQWP